MIFTTFLKHAYLYLLPVGVARIIPLLLWEKDDGSLGIRTHVSPVSRVAPDRDLSDALPTELQRRGMSDKIHTVVFDQESFSQKMRHQWVQSHQNAWTTKQFFAA